MSDDAIAAQLAAMRARYAQTSRGFIATFELIGTQLADAPDSEDLIAPLRRELHRVHGTAGSLGFHEAGRMAGAMEGLAKRWNDDPALDRHRRSLIVLSFARALAGAIASAVDDDAPVARHLLLVGLTDAVADRLVAEGVHRGLSVERVTSIASLESAQVAPTWGVVAMEDASAQVRAAGFEDAMCVLLRDDARTSRSRHWSGATVFDVEAAPAKIIDALGMIAAERGGRETQTVLLVDDDPLMLLLVRALAEDEGLLVETADSGAAFREALGRIEPALVVLDVELTDANGIDLLRAMRASPPHRNVPVLMLSGRSDSDARTAAFEAGADDYMLKPIVPAELQRRIAKLLEERRERLTSTGLHVESELPLPARTIQEIDARLVARGETHWTVGVIRPVPQPHLPDAVARWHTESARVARAVKAAGGIAGLTVEPGLAIALPSPLADVDALLHTLHREADLPLPWHGGIASTDAVTAGTSRALLNAAADAFAAARDASVPVRSWNANDVDIAPDVIVVEDDPSLTEMLEFALDAKGLSYRSYSTGPDALEALLALRTDARSPIVLLDIDLPGMDGHSLHERLRLERPGAFQVVFLSLHTSEADQLRALQGGALDYLTKPISLRVLMAKIAVWRERMRSA